MAVISRIISLLLIFCQGVHVLSLNFILYSKGGPKCFSEDLKPHSMLTVIYRIEQLPIDKNQPFTSGQNDGENSTHNHKVYTLVEISNPRNVKILSRAYSGAGKVAFAAELSGIHAICFQVYNNHSQPSTEPTLMKVHLAFLRGFVYDSKAYNKTDHAMSLLEETDSLLELIETLRQDMEIHKEREARFRETSENTNSRIFLWALCQISVFFLIGVLQMFYLRTYFIMKKLV